ncbi:hypothetical protein GTO89_11135 [Heliobacterium gestii]|uniref:Uncharacterized protein n=1 Tax=Heliomicrobium gestii TaxID=2699 RepID=A0A845LGP7_HELGE|nr:hypothetical protein [Heliomicrobium gestii]MBM7867328.1 hypothetical protein [Heliomicrobium gestii]MZP43595.1 hypothetical protein [Heliomicrobium gestii]
MLLDLLEKSSEAIAQLLAQHQQGDVVNHEATDGGTTKFVLSLPKTAQLYLAESLTQTLAKGVASESGTVTSLLSATFPTMPSVVLNLAAQVIVALGQKIADESKGQGIIITLYLSPLQSPSIAPQ